MLRSLSQKPPLQGEVGSRPRGRQEDTPLAAFLPSPQKRLSGSRLTAAPLQYIRMDPITYRKP